MLLGLITSTKVICIKLLHKLHVVHLKSNFKLMVINFYIILNNFSFQFYLAFQGISATAKMECMYRANINK
jgi:hypothetical protein